MTETADPVLIWIPLMKDLGMTWKEISDYSDIRSKRYKAANNFNINPSA